MSVVGWLVCFCLAVACGFTWYSGKTTGEQSVGRLEAELAQRKKNLEEYQALQAADIRTLEDMLARHKEELQQLEAKRGELQTREAQLNQRLRAAGRADDDPGHHQPEAETPAAADTRAQRRELADRVDGLQREIKDLEEKLETLTR